MEVLAMRWFKKRPWNVGLVRISMLFLLSCLTLIPLSTASAYQGTLRVATPTTIKVQTTPTVDATVTALSKEQLAQQVAMQQHTWGNWLWSNAATIFSSFLSTLVVVIGTLFGLWQWHRNRQDTADKELKDRQSERDKRAEERFQSAVVGLGSEKEGAKIGAAILLRTFLRPGYEQFYTQAFDLAVANLRLPKTDHASENPNGTSHSLEEANILTPPTLNQALTVVFKEAFPLAREWIRKQQKSELTSLHKINVSIGSKPASSVEKWLGHQSLDATGIQLDNAFLARADLKEGWMPQASLSKANLWGADLREANLRRANLLGVDLCGANLRGADLQEANLRGAVFFGADLRDTDFAEADMREARLFGAKLGRNNFWKANLSRADLQIGEIAKDVEEMFIKGEIGGVNLREANLAWATLSATKLNGADLSGACLSGAELIRADLVGANLSGADLRGADLSSACLSMANFKGTDLSGAKLGGTDFSRDKAPRILDRLTVTGIEGALLLEDADLRGVKGLTQEQLVACKAKGAIIDEDLTTNASQSTAAPSSPSQSNGAHTPSVAPVQVGAPPPDLDGSNTVPPQQEPVP
jgi:uncharacterized protein YjbI with pentapeptide repeats